MDVIQDVIEYDGLEIDEWYVEGEGNSEAIHFENVKLLKDVICYNIEYGNYYEDEDDEDSAKLLDSSKCMPERKFLENGTIFRDAYLVPSSEWLVLIEDFGNKGEIHYTFKLKTLTITFDF